MKPSVINILQEISELLQELSEELTEPQCREDFEDEDENDI